MTSAHCGDTNRPPDLDDLRSRLLTFAAGEDQLAYLAHVASVITDTFRILGVAPPVVVGGLAVETYTAGHYTTRDVDMIADDDAAVSEIMTALGFEKRAGWRHYEHPQCEAFVEFPTGPLEGSRDRIAEIELANGSTIYVIGIEDLILDRIAAYEHWDKRRENSEDATQAILLMVAQHDRIDGGYLRNSARQMGLADALAELEARATRLRQSQADRASHGQKPSGQDTGL